MARSFTEAINGSVFFAPTPNDFFTVQTTALPNTNPAMGITGQGGTTDLRAYGDAPTMTPNIFKVRSTGWSLSMWFNVNGNANHGGTLFAVQNDLVSGGSLNVNQPLTLQWGAVNVTALTLTYYGAAGNVTMGRSINTTSGFHLFVFNVPAPGNQATSYMNADASFTNHGVVASGADTYASGLKTCFGRYSDNGASNSMYTNPMFGKMCFHPHVMTLTECHMLYESMT